MYRNEEDDPLTKEADLKDQKKEPTQMSEPSENFGQTTDRSKNN